MSIELTEEQLDNIAFYLLTWGGEDDADILKSEAFSLYQLLKPYRNI